MHRYFLLSKVKVVKELETKKKEKKNLKTLNLKANSKTKGKNFKPILPANPKNNLREPLFTFQLFHSLGISKGTKYQKAH